MIVESTDIVPAIDGIVLIDCWEPMHLRKKIDNDFFINLIARAINHDFKSVVNAAYNVELTTQDPSIHNTFQLYCWDQGDFNTNNTEIILNLVKYCAASNSSSTLISETLLKNYNSVMLLDLKDFIFHWKYNLNSDVNHWLVAGHSWQMCLHNRPLGLERMYRDTTDSKLNFYVVPDLVQTDTDNALTRDDFCQDQLPWREIPGFGYQLITQAQKHWTNALSFYEKFVADGKIHVTIHCGKSTAHLMPKSSDIFVITVVHEQDQDWCFSYTKLLGEYNQDSVALPNKLRIWVFDILTPLDIHALIGKATPQNTAYLTQDESLVMFETSRITQIKILENFVK
jgi:hypothetical protein